MDNTIQKMNSKTKALSIEKLFRVCDPSEFSFESTQELEVLSDVFGQDRACDAINFSTEMHQDGYNLYVMGPPGIGKHLIVQRTLDKIVSTALTPNDYCYVNNFKQNHKPCAIKLPAGMAQKFRNDMQQLVEELKTSIPAAFETDEYRARLQDIEEDFKSSQEKDFMDLQKESDTHKINLFRTPTGYAFAPTREGEVISPDEFKKLPEKEQERIEEIVTNLQDKLESIIIKGAKLKRETREKIKQLNKEVMMFAVGHLIDDLKKKYVEQEQAIAYFDTVQQDIIDHMDNFRQQKEPGNILGIQQPEVSPYKNYEINVLVEHTTSSGAPIVFEDLPTHQNLVGRIEHLSQMGALVTDFTLIKPGALHRANGGYLILEANKILLQPYAWETIKRALKSHEIKIESLGQVLSLVNTQSLEPEPIPLNTKIVLLGDRLLYYMLCEYDPEFSELFKVAADFEEEIDRDVENNQLYAHLIATIVKRSKLRHFDQSGVASIIEQSSRLTGDAQKLSAHLQGISDLLKEADYWAGKNGNQLVAKSDVEKAVETKIERVSRFHSRLLEEISRGILMIDTQGEQVGQVNGLSVIALGGFYFGHPSRITATTRIGEGEIIDIEREAELGGSIHSKGVMILSSFLATYYAPETPLSLTATIVFEQSYGMIDGDSASTAELCVLLSNLANIPIKQSIAITGSVNQHGQVQAIGGVNEKIEGFFDVCVSKGLSGDQGVIIPQANVTHLMLRAKVIDAVKKGLFRVYAVSNVFEAFELLTGTVAGERDLEGRFPDGTANYLIESRLVQFAELRHSFAEKGKEKSGDE